MAKRSSRTPGGQPKRVPVSTKILPDLRDRLEAAAVEGSRTLGNEIERRLDLSFRRNEILAEEFGGERTYSVMKAIYNAWKMLEFVSDKPWNADSSNIRISQLAAVNILNMVRDIQGNPAYLDSKDENQSIFGDLAEQRLSRSEFAIQLAKNAVHIARGTASPDGWAEELLEVADAIRKREQALADKKDK